jgi:hypothetical protein
MSMRRCSRNLYAKYFYCEYFSLDGVSNKKGVIFKILKFKKKITSGKKNFKINCKD